MMRFADRVAIVTGAGDGIGRAIVLGLAHEGAKVVVADLNLAAAERSAEEIRGAGREALAIRVDVATRSDVEAMVQRTVAEWGRVDILVNNAGVLPREDFLDMGDELWDRTMAVNLRGPFLCGQVAARQMVRTGGGSIVNVTSTRAATAGVGQSAYSSSKAGLWMLTLSMALELGPHGIRVNALGPGPTITDRNRTLWSDPARLGSMLPRIPLGRLADPEDMVGPALFLAGDESRYITGQCLFVEGGYLAG